MKWKTFVPEGGVYERAYPSVYGFAWVDASFTSSRGHFDAWAECASCGAIFEAGALLGRPHHRDSCVIEPPTPRVYTAIGYVGIMDFELGTYTREWKLHWFFPELVAGVIVAMNADPDRYDLSAFEGGGGTFYVPKTSDSGTPRGGT